MLRCRPSPAQVATFAKVLVNGGPGGNQCTSITTFYSYVIGLFIGLIGILYPNMLIPIAHISKTTTPNTCEIFLQLKLVEEGGAERNVDLRFVQCAKLRGRFMGS